MPQELIMEGNQYVGTFLAEREDGFSVSSRLGNQALEIIQYHFFGSGVIRDKQTGINYHFSLVSPYLYFGKMGEVADVDCLQFMVIEKHPPPQKGIIIQPAMTLEETLLSLKSPGERQRLIIVFKNIFGFIDFTLAQMVSEIVSSKEDLPLISRPLGINPYELISRGYTRSVKFTNI